MIIWIIIIVILGLLYELIFVEKIYLPREEKLFQKVLKRASSRLDNDDKEPIEISGEKDILKKQVDEIESEHELYLRLLERFRYKKEKLKNMKEDYFNLLDSLDEIDSLIDIIAPVEELKKVGVRIDEIRKRFNPYSLEKEEP